MRPEEMVDTALGLAQGLAGCVAIVTVSSRVDLRWARTTLTTNGESRGLELTLVAFAQRPDGVATATVSRTQPDRDDIAAMVQEAGLAAAQAPTADDAAPLVAPWGRDDTAWTNDAPMTESAVFAELSRNLGDLFEAMNADGTELFGYAEHCVDTVWLGTSTGLRRRHVQPSGRLEMTAKSHARSRSTWWGVATDDFTDIDLNDALATIRRALDWQARRIDVEAGRHDCLLTPSAMGDLMVDLWWSMAARPALEGHSAFSAPGGGTRIGERLAVRPVRLQSDPHDPQIGCANWLTTGSSSDMASVFDNGIEIPTTDWIADGTLTHLVAPRRLAAEHSLEPVAPADTLRFTDPTGQGTTDDLLARLSDGIYITCLWYNRLVDPQTLLLTGLTRDGVYVVRGGEIVGATTNFRFNDSPLAALARLRDVGGTVRTLPREMGDYAPRVAMPAAVIEDFHLSTVSDAL